MIGHMAIIFPTIFSIQHFHSFLRRFTWNMVSTSGSTLWLHHGFGAPSSKFRWHLGHAMERSTVFHGTEICAKYTVTLFMTLVYNRQMDWNSILYISMIPWTSHETNSCNQCLQRLKANIGPSSFQAFQAFSTACSKRSLALSSLSKTTMFRASEFSGKKHQTPAIPKILLVNKGTACDLHIVPRTWKGM